MDILTKLLQIKTIQQVSNELNVSLGTVKRWVTNNNVPKAYVFELMNMADIQIEYSKFDYKLKDQFFTPTETAEYCYSVVKEKLIENLDEYVFIEPSAGNGSFFNILPKSRRFGLDIEPMCDYIVQQDYLKWKPRIDKKYIVIGNPPFGLRGQLALKFINHSAIFADYVCFILPQLFVSDGKGSPRKRLIGLNLIHTEKIKCDFKSPENVPVKVECIFQIWSKYHTNPELNIKETTNRNLKVYSISDGNTPQSTRNKKMIDKCDIYIPSTCFGKNSMKYYDTFKELPNLRGYGIVFNHDKQENIQKFKAIDWTKVAFLSTNSAYNIRTSQIISQFPSE